MIQHSVSRQHIARARFLQRIYASIKDVPGNVVECGVQYGYSLGMLAALIQQEGKERHLYGFDAWEPSDAPQPLSEHVPSVSWDDAFHAINAAVAASFIEPSQLHLVKGWFADTLPATNTEALVLVHLDCDAEESYWQAMKNLWPRLNAGGVVILDEYASTKWTGAKTVALEWTAFEGAYLHEDTRWYLVKA